MDLRRPAGVIATVLAVVAFVVAAVSPASAATYTAAADSFSRTVSNGLGTADTGGAWSLAGSASRFSVGGGTARLSLDAGSLVSGYLGSTAIRDADVAATLGMTALPQNGSVYPGVLARHAGSTEYQARIIVSSTGAAAIQLLAGATSLKAATVAGLTVTANTGVRIRLQVTGANPTTVRARAWKAGSAEPTAWQVSTTDGTAALQAAGSVGIRSYLGGGTTNAPIVATVDDFAATTLGAANAPPTASFTATPSGLTVAFDGTGSNDTDGTITSYAWSFGDGTTGTGATPSHTYAAGGTYTVGLTVTDDGGATGSTSSAVTVTAANVPPTASFTAASNGLTVSVDGSASADPDGTITSYAWSFGDGSTGSGATASHTYAAQGTYPVTLTVTDDQGATGTSQQQVTVATTNQPPVPTLLEQSNALTAAFWGNQSTDPDGTIVAYGWAFGDGTSGTGAALQHTYPSAGTYTVTLTLTDNGGATATLTRAISVYASGTRPTQAQWLTDLNAAIDGGSAYLDAHATVTKPAIVLDIDNTSLQSYYQPFAAIPAVLSFEQKAIADGYTILFATGRSADSGGTLDQLQAAGFRVDSLCFRDPAAPSTQASKTACRGGWTSQGYTIVANVGNHTTDLDGGNSGQEYLLPNYGFLD